VLDMLAGERAVAGAAGGGHRRQLNSAGYTVKSGLCTGLPAGRSTPSADLASSPNATDGPSPGCGSRDLRI
jgi:hypothetical protein